MGNSRKVGRLMTSTFAWLDYSARERRAMLEVVDLFREKGTVDEMGLGVIRDAFADRLFPGTSTLHSRARYWLFVPWLYRQLESERTPSARAEERSRRLQSDLVRSLEKGGESEGVIGIEARDKVLRPPAPLYWAGLHRHGLRLVAGSIGRYHTSLDSFYASGGHRRSEGDETELVEAGRRNWHAGMPTAPSGLFDSTDFTLDAAEADYLRERFVTSSPTSFLAWGLLHPARLEKVQFPWDHPHLGSAPSDLRQVVETARRFSLLMYGAVLVYNLAMAERSAAVGLRDGALIDEYREMYRAWSEERLVPELNVLSAWDRGELWAMIAMLAPGRIHRTRLFADRWIDRVVSDPSTAPDDVAIRALVADRERQMKGDLARLRNPRALERWSGRSGVQQLSYRWGEGRTLLQDIGAGLRTPRVGTA